MGATPAKAKPECGGARGSAAGASARRIALGLSLVALLVGHVGLTLVPDGIAATRVAGLSVLWWYAGLLAPVAAAAAALLFAPADAGRPRAERQDRQ